MKNTFKTKSVVPEYKDEEIRSTLGSTRFISFEAAIQMFYDRFPRIEERHVGYIVTEQGIEIVYK